MNTRQHHTLDALKRAYIFLTTNPIPTPLQKPSAGLSAQVTALKAAIDDADTEATSQLSGTLDHSLGQRDALRESLRSQHLEPILHIARELESASPGLPKLVNLRFARSSQGLLNAVQAVLRDLPPYTDLFVAKGLPADFLDELQAALTAYETAADTTRQSKTTRVQARAGIDTALQHGESYKRIIGAIIRRAVPTDPNGPTFLRGWESASHVRRGKSTAASTDTPAAPSNTTTSPAAAKPVTTAETPATPAAPAEHDATVATTQAPNAASSTPAAPTPASA